MVVLRNLQRRGEKKLEYALDYISIFLKVFR